MSGPNPFLDYRPSARPTPQPPDEGPSLGRRLQAAGLIAGFQTILAFLALEGIRRAQVPLAIGPVFFTALILAAAAGSALAREWKFSIQAIRPPTIGATAGFLVLGLLAKYVFPGPLAMFGSAFAGAMLGTLVATYWPSE